MEATYDPNTDILNTGASEKPRHVCPGVAQWRRGGGIREVFQRPPQAVAHPVAASNEYTPRVVLAGDAGAALVSIDILALFNRVLDICAIGFDVPVLQAGNRPRPTSAGNPEAAACRSLPDPEGGWGTTWCCRRWTGSCGLPGMQVVKELRLPFQGRCAVGTDHIPRPASSDRLIVCRAKRWTQGGGVALGCGEQPGRTIPGQKAAPQTSVMGRRQVESGGRPASSSRSRAKLAAGSGIILGHVPLPDSIVEAVNRRG